MNKKLGTLPVVAIAFGGMVGGGIFAVTGLAVGITHGAAPIAFIIAGFIALLTAYSYWKLTLALPSDGGTVEFINQGFGTGVLSGTLNILLCLNYVVLLSVYAYAFGSYGAHLFGFEDFNLWLHALLSGVIVVLFLINIIGADFVVKSETTLNIVKLFLLLIFIIAGLLTPMQHIETLFPKNYDVSALSIFSGAMIIFLNYEGFELVANAAKEIKDPKKTLPIAYIGSVLMTIILYVLIVTVVLGHLSLTQISTHSNYVLSIAANSVFGTTGFTLISITALIATTSAINATFYASSRLVDSIAKSKELPQKLERTILGKKIWGLVIFAFLALLLANTVPLNAIATVGSAGFLIIFGAVNWICFQKSKDIDASSIISITGVIFCSVALLALCWHVIQSELTRNHIWILVGMIAFSYITEVVYQTVKKKSNLHGLNLKND